MSVETTHTLIVGGGQAGVAMSAHLLREGIPHLVLERGRIAERWRSERWDSLVANGPAWHDRFPGMEFDDLDPGAFPAKERMARYFEAYAAQIMAPIRTGVTVTSVEPLVGRSGFRVLTSTGEIEAQSIVAATGAFQKPLIPPLVPAEAGLFQLHSAAYRNPDQLPPGAVLVVGAGSSGAQIADELNRAGRRVFLSVGPHGRPPRRYRGIDYCWWLGVLGKWEAVAPAPGTEHVTIAVSGAREGETIDFRRLASEGITLAGRTQGFEGGTMRFAADLVANVQRGDADYLSVLDEADAYAKVNGLNLPADPEARRQWPEPDCMTNPIQSLDLAAAGITTILWATGFGVDYSWLKVNAFDAQGRPVHRRGVSDVPGVYFLGLPWQSRRGSSFIWGVWHDAAFVASQIAIQRNYLDHLATMAQHG